MLVRRDARHSSSRGSRRLFLDFIKLNVAEHPTQPRCGAQFYLYDPDSRPRNIGRTPVRHRVIDPKCRDHIPCVAEVLCRTSFRGTWRSDFENRRAVLDGHCKMPETERCWVPSRAEQALGYFAARAHPHPWFGLRARSFSFFAEFELKRL